MIINSGAATGIAIVSNALTSRHSFHQGQMAAYFALLDASEKAGIMPGSDFAGALPLQRSIGAQAWLLAYNDTYRMLALLVALLAPWCLLLKPANGAQAAAEAVFE
jgi:hypothetical protein